MGDWQPPSDLGWCTYSLTLAGDNGTGTTFALRQCPRCSALVQPSNEAHHDAWHDNLTEATGC